MAKKTKSEVSRSGKEADSSIPKEPGKLRQKLDEAAIMPLKESHPAAAATRNSKEKNEREVAEVLSPEAEPSKKKDKLLSIAAGKG